MDQILLGDEQARLSVDSDKSLGLSGGRVVCLVSHLLEQLDDRGFGKGETGAGVDVGGAGDERTGGEVGGEEGARAGGRASRVDDLDGLDAVIKVEGSATCLKATSDSSPAGRLASSR